MSEYRQFPYDFKSGYPLPALPITSQPFAMVLYSELSSAGFTANLLGAIRTLSNPNVFLTANPDDALDAASAYSAVEVLMSDLCSLVADCISNSPATQQAILDLFNEQPSGPTSPQPSPQPSPLAAANLLEYSDCSNGNIYAYCLQLVQLFDALVTDTFEIMEQATNNLEVLAALIGNVPLLGNIAEAAAQLQENIAEGYAAGYTVSLENDIACDLFCMAVVDCELTLDDVVSYYGARAGATLFDNFEDAMQFITQGVFSGNLAVYSAHLALATVLRFGGSWSGNSLAGVLRLMAGIQNDSNGDWNLCDCTAPIMVWSHSGHATYTDTITGLVPNAWYELRTGNGMNQDVRWGDPSAKPAGYGDCLYWYIDANYTVQKLGLVNSGLYVNNFSPPNARDTSDNGLYSIPIQADSNGEILFELRDIAPANNSGSMAFELWTT